MKGRYKSNFINTEFEVVRGRLRRKVLPPPVKGAVRFTISRTRGR